MEVQGAGVSLSDSAMPNQLFKSYSRNFLFPLTSDALPDTPVGF